MTPEQLRAFLEAAKSGRCAAYSVLAVDAGPRPGDLAGLERKHVRREPKAMLRALLVMGQSTKKIARVLAA